MGKSLVNAFEESVEYAIETGRIDKKAQAAPIQATRKLVSIIESNPDKSANVLFPTLLKYMDALGMFPDKEITQQATKPKAKMTAFAAGSKFTKAANG